MADPVHAAQAVKRQYMQAISYPDASMVPDSSAEASEEPLSGSAPRAIMWVPLAAAAAPAQPGPTLPPAAAAPVAGQRTEAPAAVAAAPGQAQASAQLVQPPPGSAGPRPPVWQQPLHSLARGLPEAQAQRQVKAHVWAAVWCRRNCWRRSGPAGLCCRQVPAQRPVPVQGVQAGAPPREVPAPRPATGPQPGFPPGLAPTRCQDSSLAQRSSGSKRLVILACCRPRAHSLCTALPCAWASSSRWGSSSCRR